MSVFLLTLGENLGFYCSDAASRLLIRDVMLENFEPGVLPALRLMMRILEIVDKQCFEIIEIGGDLPTFTLSWFLTWYSHIIDDFKLVQRIFDAILS